MSITAQVDTSSIDVSLDMHELRTEINEVIDEAVPDIVREIISEGPDQSVIITGLIRRVSNLEDALYGDKTKGNEGVEDEIAHIHKRLDELTARLVGAGCMLTGTRS